MKAVLKKKVLKMEGWAAVSVLASVFFCVFVVGTLMARWHLKNFPKRPFPH